MQTQGNTGVNATEMETQAQAPTQEMEKKNFISLRLRLHFIGVNRGNGKTQMQTQGKCLSLAGPPSWRRLRLRLCILQPPLRLRSTPCESRLHLCRTCEN